MTQSAGGDNQRFERFQPGDNADRLISADYQNKIQQQIERLNQVTFGPGNSVLTTGPVIFRKGKRSSGTSSSSSLIVFTLDTVDCEAKTATASVIAISCGATDLGIGDSVNLVDFAGCHLTCPENLMIGLSGTASYMESDSSGGCVWNIISLCCLGETCS